jgi:hypothetical protein
METGLRELEALLEYIIKHNTEHAEEINTLAQKAASLHRDDVSINLIRGVEKMEESNADLTQALESLRKKPDGTGGDNRLVSGKQS